MAEKLARGTKGPSKWAANASEALHCKVAVVVGLALLAGNHRTFDTNVTDKERYSVDIQVLSTGLLSCATAGLVCERDHTVAVSLMPLNGLNALGMKSAEVRIHRPVV
jgi:hypothetical protein